MKIRKVIATVTGLVQEVVGLLSAVLAVMLFFDLLEFQIVFSLPVELLSFYLLILVLCTFHSRDSNHIYLRAIFFF